MGLYDSSQLMNIVLNACKQYDLMNQRNTQNPFGLYGFNTISPNYLLFSEVTFNPYADIKAKPSFFTSTDSSSTSSELNLDFSSNRALNAVKVAEAELAKGVKEINQSNDSTDIRKYKRGAVNNSPWCQYFASYCFGDGQGSSNKDTFGFDGSTQNVKTKANRLGYYARKNSGYTPKVGDLAMWTKSAISGHVGIVSAVYSDGSFDVIEGNSGKNTDSVVKNHYKSQNSVSPTFDGFVKMSEWTEAGNNNVYYA